MMLLRPRLRRTTMMMTIRSVINLCSTLRPLWAKYTFTLRWDDVTPSHVQKRLHVNSTLPRNLSNDLSPIPFFAKSRCRNSLEAVHFVCSPRTTLAVGSAIP